MTQPLMLTCQSCGRANRVQAERLAAGPKCGVCGVPLTAGTVAELNPTTLAKSINDDLPLLVDFWAPWCGPCRQMAPEFAKAATALKGRVRFAKINTQDHPQVADRLAIKGIPLLILYAGGREVARLPGARPAPEIADFVQARLVRA